MGTIVRSVKFLAWIALGSLLLTYAISLNMEMWFININSHAISNSFLFALFSGIFASTLVVLICELNKYYDTKKKVENSLYIQFAFLYVQLLIIRNNTAKMLQNPNERLAQNLLQIPTSNSNASLNAIRNLEYCTFRGKSPIELVLKSFIGNGDIKLEDFLTNCKFLEIAINEDKIEFMKGGNFSPIITSASDKTHKVLSILNKNVEGFINEIDSLIIKIDNACDNRFIWVERRNAMSQNVLYSKFGEIDDFISKYNIN